MKKTLYILILIIIAAGGWLIINRYLQNSGPRTECFKKVFADNSVIQAEFFFNNKFVTGQLAYIWAQKDNSKGTFNGIIKNNVIIGNYKFLSEGMMSDNEIAFLYDKESLAQGIGEQNADGTKFLNPDSLTFDKTNKMVKTNCLPSF
jgi:hypothetical protein